MIKQLAHICIVTKDLKETENFYCEILGLQKKFQFLKSENEFGFYVEVGNNTFIEFFYDENASNQNLGIKHFCLEVDDIDEIYSKLKSANYHVDPKKLGCDNSWQIWVTDPNGIAFEFHQYTEKSSQFSGENCEIDWE